MFKKRVLSVFTLVMINIAAICNIANIPFTAQYGFSSLFYYALGALVFFIPVGLISAELATGWPERGGVYIWVREALGESMGFTAIWMQWAENVIWYPTILSFTAATFAYIINPELAKNRIYIMTTIMIVFWGMTFINFLGMKVSGWISTFCVIIGIFLPGALIISMGIIWFILGNPSEITYNLSNFIPKITSINSWSTLAGILVIFSGLEMSAVHAKEVEKPQKNYPVAIFLSTTIIFFIFSLAALSIATVVPKGKIELASGSIEAIRYFLDYYNIHWVLNIVAVLMGIGALGMVSTWLVGPSKGLFATARHGDLPPFLQKTNKKNMPIAILVIQAILVSLLALVFLFMPTVSASYHLLLFMTAQWYLIMYLLMFISGIVLRYKKPEVKREYKVPFGNLGMWITALLGIFASILAMIFGFFPPEGYENPRFYTSFLIVGTIIFFMIPIIINKLKKPHWHVYEKE